MSPEEVCVCFDFSLCVHVLVTCFSRAFLVVFHMHFAGALISLLPSLSIWWKLEQVNLSRPP